MSGPVRVPIDGLTVGVRVLEREAAHYLIGVHRLNVGDRFVAFDPVAALEAEAVLIEAGARRAACELSEPRPGRVPAFSITLVQALAKGDKPEKIVRSATALGVKRVTFVQAERSVVRASDGAYRSERLRAVAVDAARQSGRGDLPELDGPRSLADALAEAGQAVHKLCLQPDAETTLLAALEDWRREQPLALAIGPEGGWSPSELQIADQAGFLRVRLGELTLRSELAAVAALGAALCFADR